MPPDSGASRYAAPVAVTPRVLLALDLGVDRRRVDDDLARAERGERGVDHADDVGRVRHAEDRDLARGDDGARIAAFVRARGDGRVDRAAAA